MRKKKQVLNPHINFKSQNRINNESQHSLYVITHSDLKFDKLTKGPLKLTLTSKWLPSKSRKTKNQ